MGFFPSEITFKVDATLIKYTQNCSPVLEQQFDLKNTRNPSFEKSSFTIRQLGMMVTNVLSIVGLPNVQIILCQIWSQPQYFYYLYIRSYPVGNVIKKMMLNEK